MPALIEYLVKLSVSLGVVWLFYQFVLRRLTFYNHNRWYLIGYTVLSFFIPFIDISNAIKKDQVTTNTILQWVPAFYSHSVHQEKNNTVWNFISLIILIGIAIMLVRLAVQLISFKRMKTKAELISSDEINIYQVNESIIPFSFGHAVFINKKLHTEEELKEIIRHEFVHVQQRHSVDIILSELLCLCNWYNPFAWMLRSSIRQNLEFIADNKVLQNGFNKKQYQYLLLKVIGNDQFSIAQKFNFSSLKKRIAMMNKNKSTKSHLLRFLFVLPVLALILVSFRKEIGDTLTGKNKQLRLQDRSRQVGDTIPAVIEPNEKGYIINVIDKEVKGTLVIKDKNGKEIKRLLLSEWNANIEKYEALYGAIPPPPNPPTPPVVGSSVDIVAVPTPPSSVDIVAVPTPPSSVDIVEMPIPPIPPAPVKLPENVQRITINNGKVVVWLKNGEKENYDLNDKSQKVKFEKKYGELIPPAPTTPVAAGADTRYSSVSDEYEITDKKAVIHLRNGKTEKYDLTNKEEHAAFEKKYGKIINTTLHTNMNTIFDMSTDLKTNIAPSVNAVVTGNVKPSVNSSVATHVTPVSNGIDVIVGNVTMDDKYGYKITGDEAILLTVTQTTSKEELQSFIKQMKEKGIDLSYNDMIYKNGKLVKLTGTMKSKDSQSNFVGIEFEAMQLAMIKDGEKTWFKVSVRNNNRVVI